MEEVARGQSPIPPPARPNDEESGAEALRDAFDRAAPYTVGIEDEVMLLHPETLELAPV